MGRAVRLLCSGLLVVGASAFVARAPLRTQTRAIAVLQANEFDVWWEQRRKRGTGGKHVGAAAAAAAATASSTAPDQLQLSVEKVSLVLSEFVRSTYARQCFNNVQAPGTDYGTIEGMFEYVRLAEGGTLVLKLKRSFNERNEALLDRLSRYLRERIPQVKAIHAQHRDGMDIY